MPEYRCDNYDELTGEQSMGTLPAEPEIETKVVQAPETPEPAPADVTVETA